jgi:hypothetical protein
MAADDDASDVCDITWLISPRLCECKQGGLFAGERIERDGACHLQLLLDVSRRRLSFSERIVLHQRLLLRPAGAACQSCARSFKQQQLPVEIVQTALYRMLEPARIFAQLVRLRRGEDGGGSVHAVGRVVRQGETGVE